MQALRNNQLAAAIDDANLTPDIRADIHANWSACRLSLRAVKVNVMPLPIAPSPNTLH
ncbi:hypothetical protein ACLB1O_12725 [Escherichia coli]